MKKFAVGIDLGSTNLKGALVEIGAGIVKTDTLTTPALIGPDAVLDSIADLVRSLAAQSPSPIIGVGLGSPGVINWERTTVTGPPNIAGWTVVNVARELVALLNMPDLPVLVENDANVAALGSAHYGVGRQFDSFIMVTLGTGVGGAIIYRNEIFRGTTGGAAEIGHMTIDYEGPLDRAGVKGAVEAYIGQRFLSEYARLRLLNEPPSRIHELAGPDLESLTPLMLFEAAREGDTNAAEILSWAGHKLGVVLGSAVNLLDIRKIVVGGGLSGAGDFILDATRATLPKYVLPGLHEGLEIVREDRGNSIALAGAAHMIAQAVLR